MEVLNRGVYSSIEQWRLDEINIMPPTEQQLRQAEELFEKYIFFKDNGTKRMLTTTCCHKKSEWTRLRRIETEDTRAISYGKHNEKVKCPYCGMKVQLKNINKLGKKKKLKEYQPILFLNEKNGNLHAVGCWALKDYRGDLNEPPVYKVTYCYRFSIGSTQMYNKDFGKWCISENEGSYNPSNSRITEPVAQSTGWYGYKNAPYHLIGGESIDKSNYKYCQYKTFQKVDTYTGMHEDLIRYLAIYSIYPKNVEMLVKSGLFRLVDDMICGRKKNADIIKWGEADPRKAFKLDGQELKQFMKEMDINSLRIYQKLKRNKFKATFELAKSIAHSFPCEAMNFIKHCKKYKITPERSINYMNKFTGSRCYGGYYGPEEVLKTWTDYLDMAAWLGYDITAETVIMPKNLERAHNEAATEQQHRLDIEKAKTDKKKNAEFKKSLRQREKKYNFEYKDMFIRVAASPEEVVKEGKVLAHCVAGYASRHIENKLTILFLREKSRASIPLVTVEMNGNDLRQAHGFKNEKDGAQAPKIKYKEFFEVWLGWIKAGSRRKKDGTPILPKEIKKIA